VSKANAQATAGSVLFDSCFVKGARVPAGIRYTVRVQVTVDHPAFANQNSTATIKVSDSATPPVVIFQGPLIRNGASRVGGTSTPAGFPNITNPTFPLIVEVIINNPALGIINVPLTLSGGSRARIVPATIDSPFMNGPNGIDWVHITGQGRLDKLGNKQPFKPTLPANKTGDFVEEFQVTDWWDMATNSYKPFRVETFQGSSTTPILARNYQLESGFKRHFNMPLRTSDFNEMPPMNSGIWGTNFESRFLKGTTPSHTTTSPSFYW